MALLPRAEGARSVRRVVDSHTAALHRLRAQRTRRASVRAAVTAGTVVQPCAAVHVRVRARLAAPDHGCVTALARVKRLRLNGPNTSGAYLRADTARAARAPLGSSSSSVPSQLRVMRVHLNIVNSTNTVFNMNIKLSAYYFDTGCVQPLMLQQLRPHSGRKSAFSTIQFQRIIKFD